MIRCITLLMALFTLSNCGKKNKSSPIPPNDTSKQIEVEDNIGDFAKLIRKRTGLGCGENSCPDQVVSIYVSDRVVSGEYMYQHNITLCSGTLIDPHHVLSNYHCIQSIAESYDTSCENKAVVMNQQSKVGDCEEIIYDPSLRYAFSVDHLGTPDMAIIKLKNPLKIDHHPPLSTEGIINQQPYHSYVVDFGSTITAPALIQRKDCAYNEKNIFTSLFNTEGRPQKLFHQCQVRKGNSGSAVYNQNEEIVGLIYAMIETPKKLYSIIKDAFKDWHFISIRSVYEDIPATIGFSIDCLEKHQDSIQWNKTKAGCNLNQFRAWDQEKSLKQFSTQTLHDVGKWLLEEANLSSPQDQIFEYDFFEERSQFFYQPKCLQTQKLANFFPDPSEAYEDGSIQPKRVKGRVYLDFDTQNFAWKVDPNSSYLETTEEISFFARSTALDLRFGNTRSPYIIYDCEDGL